VQSKTLISCIYIEKKIEKANHERTEAEIFIYIAINLLTWSL